MPTIHRIHSVKIDIYSRDHLPPHFHAIYGEFEALVEIRTVQVYAGYLPVKQLNEVLRWASAVQVKQMLLTNFFRLNPRLKNEKNK